MLIHLNRLLARLAAAGIMILALGIVPSIGQAAPSITLATAQPAQEGGSSESA